MSNRIVVFRRIHRARLSIHHPILLLACLLIRVKRNSANGLGTKCCCCCLLSFLYDIIQSCSFSRNDDRNKRKKKGLSNDTHNHVNWKQCIELKYQTRTQVTLSEKSKRRKKSVIFTALQLSRTNSVASMPQSVSPSSSFTLTPKTGGSCRKICMQKTPSHMNTYIQKSASIFINNHSKPFTHTHTPPNPFLQKKKRKKENNQKNKICSSAHPCSFNAL